MPTPFARPLLATAVLGTLLACGGGGGGGSDGPGIPEHQASAEQATKLAGIGDSIMQGMDATGSTYGDIGDQLSYSFGQGTSNSVFSLNSRYKLVSKAYAGQEFASRSGAEMIGNPESLPNAVDQAKAICNQATKPNRVVILLGANDVCDSASASQLPAVASFAQALVDALDMLANCLPRESRVHVLSIPRIDLLHAAVANKQSVLGLSCQEIWDMGLCPAVVENPTAVADRIVAYNDAILSAVTGKGSEYAGSPIYFSTDWKGASGGPSIGNYAFGPGDVSSLDCFHPSIAGQKKLACAAWESWEGMGDATACF